MELNMKNIKGATFLITVAVAFVGFIISTTKGAVQVTQTLDRVNATQAELLQSNAEQHQQFNRRLSDAEAWILRKEGYDAAMAEVKAKNDATN